MFEILWFFWLLLKFCVITTLALGAAMVWTVMQIARVAAALLDWLRQKAQ